MKIACTLPWPSDVFTWTWVQVCAFYTWTYLHVKREKKKKLYSQWMIVISHAAVCSTSEWVFRFNSFELCAVFFSLSMFLATINFATIILLSSADCLSVLHQVWQNIHTFSICFIFFFFLFCPMEFKRPEAFAQSWKRHKNSDFYEIYCFQFQHFICICA